MKKNIGIIAAIIIPILTLVFLLVIFGMFVIFGILVDKNRGKDLEFSEIEIEENKIDRVNNNVNENNIINNTQNEMDKISGYSYIESKDQSLLELKKDGTFKYYKNKTDLTDYYYEGTYKVYNGQDAVNYISNNLKEYGVTKDEQIALFVRSNHKLENYYCIVLINDKCIINGENTLTNTVETPYFGFYYSEVLNITNMKSANTYNFVKQD